MRSVRGASGLIRTAFAEGEPSDLHRIAQFSAAGLHGRMTRCLDSRVPIDFEILSNLGDITLRALQSRCDLHRGLTDKTACRS